MKNLQRKEVLTQSRWRSKPTWIVTLGFLGFVLKTYFDIEITKYDHLVEGLLLLATAWGLFNNPTDSENF